MAEKTVAPGSKNGEPERFSEECTIEVGDERNRSFMWGPTKDILRGRWTRTNLHGDEMVDQTVRMPDVPGMHIVIDGRKRRLAIIDPLGKQENRNILDEIKVNLKNFSDREQTAHPDKVVENATDNQIKTWLYWAYRLLQGAPVDKSRRPWSGGPQARIVSGQMPDFDRLIGFAGKIRSNLYDETTTRRYMEERLQQIASQEV